MIRRPRMGRPSAAGRPPSSRLGRAFPPMARRLPPTATTKPLACWTCGREVTPMRFRANDLHRQGWTPLQEAP